MQSTRSKPFFKRNLFLHIVTNLALAFLIVSVGFVCLYPEEQSVPIEYSEENVYRRGAYGSDGVSLMFNVYENTDVVYQILKVLERHEAKATFFVGGSWADDNAQCLKDILSFGHELGNHGYFHKDHDKLGKEKNKEEISVCNDYVELVCGKKMTLFAPPSGAYNDDTKRAVKELGMKMILWSKDTVDWRDRNAAIIYTRATKNVTGGDFVLMHPKKETADALDDILRYYEKHALRAITVSENLQIGG